MDIVTSLSHRNMFAILLREHFENFENQIPISSTSQLPSYVCREF